MNMRLTNRRSQQQGVTMVVVLVLLTVMLLGGLAMARMTEVGTLATGNAAFKETALQASEVGIHTAFTDLTGMASEDADTGGWYFATVQPQDANGIPTLNFDAARQIVVGAYTVAYAIDRQCDGSAGAVIDPLRQCLLRIVVDPKKPPCRSSDCQKLDPPTTRQYRITVRVTGPKDTQVWVQSLVTKGQS